MGRRDRRGRAPAARPDRRVVGGDGARPRGRWTVGAGGDRRRRPDRRGRALGAAGGRSRVRPRSAGLLADAALVETRRGRLTVARRLGRGGWLRAQREDGRGTEGNG